jgi:hypothetical protein
MHSPSPVLPVLGLLLLASCSAQQAYGTGQAWQLKQCHKLVDPQERSRCLAIANMSHDEYKRQAESARSPQ